MWKVATWLGNFAGALSLALLLKQGISEGFAAPLRTLFDYYDELVQFLLGWVHPFLAPVVTFVARAGGHDHFILSPDWRHIFVALAVPATAAWRAMSGEHIAMVTHSKEIVGMRRVLALVDVYCASYLALLFLWAIIALFAGLSGSLPKPDVRFVVVGAVFAAACLFVIMIPLSGWIIAIMNGGTQDEEEAKALFKPMATNLFAITGGSIVFLLLNAGLKLAGL